MKKYSYTAKNPSGENISGMLLANSIDEAAEMLRLQKYFPLELTEEKPALRQRTAAMLRLPLQTSLKTSDIIAFCRQLSIMIKSGITLKDSIDIISRQVKNRPFKNILYAVSLQIQTGKTLSDSILAYKNFFPQTLLMLIAVGEASGKLDEVLSSAAEHLEQAHTAGEKLKTAAAYPVILVIVFLITSSVMLVAVLPMFAGMLSSLSIPLPPITKLILFLGAAVKSCGFFLLLLLPALFAVLKILWTRKKYQYAVYSLLFKIPLAGRLTIEIILLQFCSQMSVMLGSGLTIDKTVTVILNNAPNIYFEQILKNAQTDIRKGYPLSFALSKSKLFPPLFMQMLTAGEKSGNLVQMMANTASFYQNDVSMLYKRLTALAEPCMIIVISIFIGAFVAAIALPMFDAASRVPM